MKAAPYAVHTEGLRKYYGNNVALDGMDLTIPHGTVCGLLGPNGAGKTTAVRILTTLQGFDSGQAWVAGFDVARRPGKVREHIGLTGQYAAVDEVLSGRQNLEMFARLFHLGGPAARRRATELLDRFRLADTGNKPVKQYSGGMRRRLDLAASMIREPSVLFLDEPTTGLDPRGRNEVWESVRSLVRDGTSVLLTTQYLDEADQLADRVAVLESGRIIASGSPEQLKSALGGDRIDVVLADASRLASAAATLTRVTGEPVEQDPDNRRLSAPVRDRLTALTGVAAAFQDAGISTEDIVLRRSTLDEVFLHLTGAHEEVAA